MNNKYAWGMALFSCLTLMVSNGLTLTGLSVYDVEFINTFGWSMGEIKLRDMITLAMTGLLAPFIGILMDRYGVRKCMMFGWIILLVGYFAYSKLDNLGHMYWIHAAFALVLVVCGLNAAVILVSNWFVKYRGTAIGIALVGTSLGGVLFPQYGTAMIASIGWRTAFLVAMIFPFMMVLITWLLVRDKPECRQDHADVEVTTVALSGVTYSVALRSGTFWAIALIAMVTFYSVLGMQAHVFKYMSDAGFSAQLATNAISLFFFCALVGKFGFGLLSDFVDHKKVLCGNMLVMLLGSFILSRMQTELIWLAVITFGFGWGGVYTTLQLTVMNSFGTLHAGKILGTITVLDALGGGLGIWLTGVLYDKTGSYELPFTIFVALVAFAVLCLTQVKSIRSSDGEALI